MTKKNTGKSMVAMARVSKVYTPNIQALDDVSLSVPRGAMLFLTGMSGSGKTTLLKLICGIETPTKGMIEVGGKDLGRLKAGEIPLLRREIGMAHQDFKLLPDRTVAQNIGMAMEVIYAGSRAIRTRVDELLERLNLTPKRDILTSKLSRGEQQRVAIARAMANRPPLILADEPTGNLDYTSSTQVMDLFRESNLRGATVILATHDESIFQPGKDRVLELSFGKFTAPLA
jgi:cell division transport system ATP-binding protein